MKRFLSIALALVLAFSLVACGQAAPASSAASEVASAPAESASQAESLPESAPAEVPAGDYAAKVAALKGPTTLGMLKLMQDSAAGTASGAWQVETLGAPDEIVPLVVKGELDMAAVPANLASVLYNKTEGNVQVAAINTLGVLYVVTTGDDIASVADLAGKTIYMTGKGATPEYVVRHILTANGMDPDKDVTLEYKSEATEVLATLKEATEPAVAVLPQPFATAAQMQVEGLKTVLDLTAEWDAVTPESALITGVLVVNKAFAEANPDAVAAFLADYKASVEYVNANVEEAGQWAADAGVVAKAPIAQKAIPACNITFIDGADMQAKLSGYLQVLFDQNPKAVGGAMPADDFYYGI